jgi:hypothetical protein
MMNVRRIVALGLVLIAGCSSERKLSHVESRVPASTGGRQLSAESALRARLASQTLFHAACPVEVRELAALASEHVSFPPCPDSLAISYQAARSMLSLEENTAVEEMMGVQCRRSPREGISEAISSILREQNQKPVTGARDQLRVALRVVEASAEPLNLWMRNNGELALPEEQLLFLDRLVNHDSCKMSDQEIDLSYRVIRNLDELVRIQSEAEPQRRRMARLLLGVHKIMDRKIGEYFRR